MQPRVLTVSEVTQYIKRIITHDPILHHLHIKGEISNYKAHSSGHWYFTLKDQQSRLSCVMFSTQNQKLKFEVENGMKVTLSGSISVYERDGQYQLYVNEMAPDGVGALYTAYLQLKDKLEKEGLFDQKYKQPIPLLPKKIALITSPTGAALRDMITIMKRRFPTIALIVFPVLVQGQGAKTSLVQAFEQVNDFDDIDLIITGRGGGSIEELWAFNEEEVARAIFTSRIPVISAVGHETDYTIADFVADLRAPTPSAAAELAVPVRSELIRRLDSLHNRMKNSVFQSITRYQGQLAAIYSRSSFQYPLQRVNDYRQQLDYLGEAMQRSVHRHQENRHHALNNLGSKLHSLSPLSVLKRGYTLVQTPDGKPISRVDQVEQNQRIQVRFKDGKIHCLVMEREKEEMDLEESKI